MAHIRAKRVKAAETYAVYVDRGIRLLQPNVGQFSQNVIEERVCGFASRLRVRQPATDVPRTQMPNSLKFSSTE